MTARNQLLLLLAENLTIFVKHMHPHDTPESERRCILKIGGKITPALKHALMMIGTDGSLNVSQLATMLKVTPGAATQHVAALEKLKLVERKASSADRREVTIQLTALGHDMYKDIRAEFLQSLDIAFEDLDDEELQQFVELMSKANAKYIIEGNAA